MWGDKGAVIVVATAVIFLATYLPVIFFVRFIGKTLEVFITEVRTRMHKIDAERFWQKKLNERLMKNVIRIIRILRHKKIW